MQEPIRVCFLASGSGTTVRESLKAIKDGRLTGVEPALVISNRSAAGVLQVAREAGMNARRIIVMPRSGYESDEARGEDIIHECTEYGVTHIAQFGWLPKTPKNVIDAFKGKIWNQHPARLDPGFADFGGQGMCGLAAVAANLYFAELTGWRDPYIEAAAHHVTEEVDGGALIAVKPVEIIKGETPKDLQHRLLPHEWDLQITVLQDFARGELRSFTRNSRLVQENELPLLAEAKRLGRVYAQLH